MRATGIHYVGMGVSGGEEGALHGPSLMPGGTVESWETLGPILRSIAAGRARRRAVRDARRHRRRRPLREDGPQRHRVRRHAAHRRGLRPPPGRHREVAVGDRRHIPGMEYRRARVVSHRDHRRGAPPGRRLHRTAARRRHSRPGRREGHRCVDGAERRRPRDPARRHRGGALREVALVENRSSAPRAPHSPGRPRRSCRRTCTRSSSRTSARRSTRRRSSRTRRASTSSAPAPPSTTGTSRSATWRRSGAPAASSRARFLNRITEAYVDSPAQPLLLAAPYFAEAIERTQSAWRSVVTAAVASGVPAPAFAASLAYYDGLRAKRLPAALIQAQRDFFGAHTYQRVDREGTFHTLWSGDRTEISAADSH